MATPRRNESSPLRLFDAHCHIIDPRFPLVANQGYTPKPFTVEDYRERVNRYDVIGGVVVSASFQAFDQTYLLDALPKLGTGFVGVTQLAPTVTDEQLIELNNAGVRGLRFNVLRAGRDRLRGLDHFARRVHEVAGWHVELYIDASALAPIVSVVAALPAVSIDHLGLTHTGEPTLLRLVEHGVRVKASGFGRVDFDVRSTLQDLHAANPHALMFGTDLPSTRAPRAFADDDVRLLIESFDDEQLERVCFRNALEFYRL